MKSESLLKNLKKGIVPVWILVVLAIVATIGSGVAFFVLKGNLGPGKDTSSMNTGIPCVDCVTDPIFGGFGDPTADWKVYENLEAGIRFKYPGGWTVEEPSSPGTLGTIVEVMAPEVNGPSMTVYSNFVGGFECYETEETKDLVLKSGESVEIEVTKETDVEPCTSISNPDKRIVLVTVYGIGESGLILYSFDKVEAPDGLETIDLIVSTFEIL